MNLLGEISVGRILLLDDIRGNEVGAAGLGVQAIPLSAS